MLNDVRQLTTSAITGLAVLVALTTQGAFACGIERWPVKVGTDREVEHVDLSPIPTTVAALDALLPPANPRNRRKSRFEPTELQVYTVHATLIEAKREADLDYHLVLRGPSGQTMIVESPSPVCAKGSRFLPQLREVRSEIRHDIGYVTKRARHMHVPVTVTGVAFFDERHGQTGVAPNAIELHPVLDFEAR